MTLQATPSINGSTDLIIFKVDKARALLAEARDAGDAKRVADIAHAAEIYARRQKLSEDAIAYATAVKVDAMTMMGEFLKSTPKNEGAAEKGIGRRGKQRGSDLEPRSVPTLADMGIDKKESMQSQDLAILAEKKPEIHEEVRKGKVSIPEAVREAKRVKKQEALGSVPIEFIKPQNTASKAWLELFGLIHRRMGGIRKKHGSPTEMPKGSRRLVADSLEPIVEQFLELGKELRDAKN